MPIEILRAPIPRVALSERAAHQFGDMVKGVVDVRRRVMAIGGELHLDEEADLLEDGSMQEDLWGINLYPAEAGEGWIEFDSMTNLRPSQGNRSRAVESEVTRQAIRVIVSEFVQGEPAS